MLGVIRRKVASGSSPASTARHLLQKSRANGPSVSLIREESILLQGNGCVRNIFHIVTPGRGNTLRPNSVALVNPSLDALQHWRSFSSDSDDLVDAVVPFMGESISAGSLATFLKKLGDRVAVDEPIAQTETDKVTIDVTSPEAGVLQKFVAKEGETVEPGTKIAVISKSREGATSHVAPSDDTVQKVAPSPPPSEKTEEKPKVQVEAAPSQEKPKTPAPAPPPKRSATEPQLPPKYRERRIPMTRLRKRVAARLKDSQNTFALLTTFNEVDMTNLMKLRSDYKDAFVEKHGVKLGLMSGFVKAAVSGLQNQPIINGVIDGDDIIYRDYVDISIADGTPKGLVVPVIRNAEKMNFADIEKEINTLAKKSNDGSISIDEMAGGTFTISNGDVYGSLLSTPIINPPQICCITRSGVNIMNFEASLSRRVGIKELVKGVPAYNTARDVAGGGLNLLFKRWATKKTAGSTKNGRDSLPKFLGVKKFGGEIVIPGNIIVRQRGTRFHPGNYVGIGKDHTLFALKKGLVKFECHKLSGRKWVHIVPKEGHTLHPMYAEAADAPETKTAI